jgi:type I restriction enzyme S subunit
MQFNKQTFDLWCSAGGEIPEGWDLVPFGSFLESERSITVGVMYPGNHYQSGIPLVRVGDIQNGTITKEPDFRVNEKVNEEYKRTIIKGDELLITLVGNPGVCVVATDKMIGWNVARAIAVARLKDSSERNFIKTVFESNITKHIIQSFLNTTVQPTLNLKEIKILPIPLPPREERREIANIVSLFNDKIELNRQMNVTLEAIARTLFKAWFMDFEPVRANMENRLSESASPEIAKLFPSEFESGIPKGWRVGMLSEIANNHRQNISHSEVENETVYVGLEHIPRKSIALTDWGKADKAESTKSNFKTNDILFGKLRPYFHKVVIAPINGICSTDILVIRPKEKYHFGQTLICFSSDEVIQYADRLSNGAKMPRTNWSDLAKFEIIIPTKQVSEEFSKFVVSIAEKIKLNINENQKLAQIRDSLLPHLISGKIRVGEIKNDIEVEIE